MKSLLFLLLLLPVLAEGQKTERKITAIMAQYPIDEPSMNNLNDGIKGRWKFVEDTNKNNFYEIIRGEPYKEDRYHIKFWDRGGKNPTYESNLHFSKIGGYQFINVPYFERGFTHSGYFFLKILNVNADYTAITAAVVNDTHLWDLKQDEVRLRISKNVNNPEYYAETIHLYKVKQGK